MLIYVGFREQSSLIAVASLLIINKNLKIFYQIIFRHYFCFFLYFATFNKYLFKFLDKIFKTIIYFKYLELFINEVIILSQLFKFIIIFNYLSKFLNTITLIILFILAKLPRRGRFPPKN